MLSISAAHNVVRWLGLGVCLSVTFVYYVESVVDKAIAVEFE